MPRGKLTKVEKYCIDKKFEEGCGFEEIAYFLDRSESVVEKYVESKLEEEPPKPPKKPNTSLFIKRTGGKGEKSVSIMTEAESSRGDEVGKTRKVGKRFQRSTHIIHDNDE